LREIDMAKNYDDPNQPEMQTDKPCPGCQNDNVDLLIWDDFDNIDGPVTCLTCGTRYHPHHPEIPPTRPS
jgi:hypothetical protein